MYLIVLKTNTLYIGSGNGARGRLFNRNQVLDPAGSCADCGFHRCGWECRHCHGTYKVTFKRITKE